VGIVGIEVSDEVDAVSGVAQSVCRDLPQAAIKEELKPEPAPATTKGVIDPSVT
jgi:hypothetical protein